MTTVYASAGEDIDFIASGAMTIVNGDGRSVWTRCTVGPQPGSGVPAAQGYLAGVIPFSASSFWFSARWIGINARAAGNYLLRFVDAGLVTRLSVEAASGVNQWAVFKINSVGIRTQLGANFTVNTSGSTIWKFDIQVVVNATGTFNIYFGDGNLQVLVFSFSGDTTTDGVTSIANYRLFSVQTFAVDHWSEVFVIDEDTRAMGRQTFAPVANGNTHNFDTGTPQASNVNPITVNTANLDGSTAAGQIDQYTTGAVVAGTFAVAAYGISAFLIRGASGPSKMDINVRTGGTDYFSSDQSLDVAWACYQNIWTTNPDTSAPWLTSQIGAAAGFNIGLKSVT